MSLGAFMGAVGDAFGGYAQDQKNHALDADRMAEQSLRNRQAKKLDREDADDAFLRSPEFGQAYAKAYTTGDTDAIGTVVRMVAGHPQGTEIIKTLTREPKPDKTVYDSNRGAVVNTETGTATVPKGLPPAYHAPVGRWVYGGVGQDGQPVLVNTETGETKTGGGLRGGGGRSDPNLHKASVLKAQIADAVGQLRVARKTTEFPLSSRATSTDSLNYNTARANIPRLEARGDSLRGVMDKVAAGMIHPQTPPTYSADPQIAAAQKLWDAHPEIQAARPRPE